MEEEQNNFDLCSVNMAEQDKGESSETSKERVLATLRNDMLSADLTWSLFVAALGNYRHDTVLRPSPPHFTENGEKDFKKIKNVVHAIPSLSQVILDGYEISEDAWYLLDWVLNSDRKPFQLTAVPAELVKNEVEQYQKLTNHSEPTKSPDYIFQVGCSDTVNGKFETKLSECSGKRLYGYHGSRLENWHSILHSGLSSVMNKTSLFGEGTYLSNELTLSMHYSPHGTGWKHSQLGRKLSCIAMCEIIDHPAIKCSIQGDSNKQRGLAHNSEGGTVPERYFVVSNNELLRIKSLLVYVDSTPQQSLLAQRPSWLKENSFILTMLAYALCLVAIGLANSKPFKRFLRNLMKS
ncbi:PREDICTED: mono [ADP-ribose] polymerase PARP16-like [Priapulus caudatus]|uniref:Poly [ADP-ribose] polymerase n=1 Tax=Priapulus caudatus TaxID=37621 RepID=A0ABM1EGD5_PRICU|nr:PREDICTED: mono [ADP-ribose] polymerase PARP16-like [Priapulus caudatus]